MVSERLEDEELSEAQRLEVLAWDVEYYLDSADAGEVVFWEVDSSVLTQGEIARDLEYLSTDERTMAATEFGVASLDEQLHNSQQENGFSRS